MIKKQNSNVSRLARHARVRKKISGTAERPRLCVFRSLKNIYAQIIDDTTGTTLVSASSLDADRGGYVYHGRVAELAAGAREGGLKF